MNEHEMSDLLERAGSGLDPDVAGLVAGGAGRGRTLRRRRRSGVALGAVTLVGATVFGAAVAPDLVGGDDPGRSTGGFAGAPTSPAGLDEEAPTSAPGELTESPTPPAAPQLRRFGPDPAEMGRVLGERLEGRVTQPRAWDQQPDDANGFQAGSVLLDGAMVSIVLEHSTVPGCGQHPPGAECTAVPGGHLTSLAYEEPASGGGPTGIFAATATYFTDDGFSITAIAWNAPSEKNTDPVLADPVLTEQQVADLVQDPIWLE
ncbi:hypothetical protein [Nocardioides sp. W7]|uniref:hypothetical protein n=1 Tax=Nocardioides sp. W7 TaxID=2931390 RepID=UPI001FCFF0F8|nr:hypothetical protein [Nocardioides sp. W7]